MARISKYTKDSTVEKTDKLIGSNLNGDTANFTIDDIAKFLRETNLAGNPDQVTYYYDGNQSTGYLDSPSVTNFESSSTRTIRFSIYSYGNTSDTRADFLDTFSGRFTLLINVDDPNNFMMAKVTNIATSGDYKTFTFAAPEHGKGSFVAGKVYSFLLHQGDAGDITDVTSATTNQLTVANGAGPAPALTIVTGAIANGGTGLATADQIHTFVTGQTDAIAASTTGNAATATKIASITNSDIVQLTSSQTLTNKILTSPVINTGISGTAIKDEDDMSSNSATHLATQQSIKAYVDTQIATEDTIAELNDTTIGTLANGHLLLYDNDSSVWENKALSGDATITKDGALTLGTVYSGSSSVGSSTAIPVLTIDGKGRITGTSTASISSTLTVGADSGSNDTVTIGTDTLDFSGGTGIDTTVSDNDISIAIDSTVTTLTGSQTLTNKTLTSPVINTGVSGTAIKDEDDMASDSATHLATQQSIKAYVDASTTNMITVSANNSTDETVYPVFVDGATGSQGAETDTGLTYNPSSGLLTSTSFSGNLTGNVTGNVSGTAATVTSAAQTAITSLGTLTSLAVNSSTTNTVATFTSTDAGANISLTDNSNRSSIEQNTADLIIHSDPDDSTGSSQIKFMIDGATKATLTAAANLSATTFTGALTGNVTGNVSGTAATVTGAAQSNITSLGTLTTLTVDNVIINGSTIGHTGDTDLMTVASGVLTVAGEIDATSLDISGDADIDGTTNLDAVDIDGAVQLDGTFTVGVDDTGYDVKFFGATSGRYLLWDESDDALEFTDNVKASFGNSVDLQIYHDGSDSYIREYGAVGDLKITAEANAVEINKLSGDDTGGHMGRFVVDGGVELYHNQSKKFETTSAGATVTGTLTADAFSGPLTGNVTGTTSLVTVSDSTANTNFPVVFHDESNALLDDTGALRYNPSTGTLLVPNLNVAGTTTQVNTVTMEAANAVVFEGATSDAHETTLSIVDPTADHTQYLINQGGYIPVLAAATTTAITATPAELNLLDTAAANTVVNSKAVIYGSSGELAGTLSTAAQGNVTSLGTLTTLTVDDITINGSTISDADHLTIDSGNYIYLDADGGNIVFQDNGTSIGSLSNQSSNFTLVSSVQDKDIIFKGNDDGSTITALTLDMSEGGNATFAGDITVGDDLFIADGGIINVGTGNDFNIQHDGTDSIINNNTGHVYFTNYADDRDIYFRSDDGSGGVAVYFYLDGSGTRTIFEKLTRHVDDVYAAFGSDSDLRIYHDGSNSYIKQTTGGTGDLIIEQDVADKDIIFKCDDGSGGTEEYFRLDGSANGVHPQTSFPDNSNLTFGSGPDTYLYHNGTDFYLSEYTGHLKITNYANDKDIIFSSDDGAGGTTAYFTLDGSLATHNGSFTTAVYTLWGDRSHIAIGGAKDMQLYHDGSNSYIEQIDGAAGDLIIQQGVDDKDIIFKSDDGSGGTTAYLTIDGSEERILADKHINLVDSAVLQLGSSQDLRLYHNGSHSYIMDAGTGGLYIQTNGPAIYFQDTDGNAMAQFTDGGSCFLMHNGSTRLHTTSDGVTVTGDLLAKASDGSILSLQTSETTVVDGDVLGSIKFSAPDEASGTDAILTGAEITAVAEGTFAADNNATELLFKVGASEAAATALTIASTKAATFAGDVTAEGSIASLDGSSQVFLGEYSNGAVIWLDGSDGDLSGGDYFGIHAYGTDTLAFSYGATTKMIMDNEGKLGLNGTTPNDYHDDADDLIVGSGSGNTGMTIRSGTSGYGSIFFADGTADDATEKRGQIRYLQGTETMDFHTDNVATPVLTLGATGVATFTNATASGTAMYIRNYTNAEADTKTLIDFRVQGSDNSPYYVAGQIGSKAEGTWTSTSSSRDASLIFNTVLNGNNELALTLRSDKLAAFQGDVTLPTAKALYLDGGGGTYIIQATDGVIDFYGDTVHLVSMKQNGTQNEVVVNEASGDVDFRVEANNDTHALFVEAEGSGGVAINHDNTDFHANASNLVVGSGSGNQGMTIFSGSSAGNYGSIYFADGRADGAEEYRGMITYEQNNEVMRFHTNTVEALELGLNQQATFAGNIITESGTVLIGGSTGQATTSGTGTLQVLGTGHSDSLFTIAKFKADASAPSINFLKSRHATIGSNTIVQDDDNLGEIVFAAADGNDFTSYAAKIMAEVDGTPGQDDMPGRIGFYTTADGAAAPTLALTLDKSQNATFAGDITLKNNATLSSIGNVTIDIDSDNDATDRQFRVTQHGAGNTLFFVNEASSQFSHSLAISGGALSITGDGSNAVTLTESGGGDFTIDAAGDIAIDADGGDIRFKDGSVGTFGMISNSSSDFVIHSQISDKDILFKGEDDTSTITALTLDMSEGGNAAFRGTITLGVADSSSGHINAYENMTFNIDTDNDDTNRYFAWYTNGSDGTGTELLKILETGNATFAGNISLADSKYVYWGGANDFYIGHTGSATNMINSTGALNIEQHADDGNIVFKSDDGAGGIFDYFSLDGGSTTHDGSATTAAYTKWQDNSRIALGTGKDLQLYHNGSNSYIENDTGHFYIKNKQDDGDIIFQSDDGSGGTAEYLRLDGGVGYTVASKDIRFDDSISACFGTGIDAFFNHNGSHFNFFNDIGDVNFTQRVDDGSIKFYNDDGSGGTEVYLTIDGNNQYIRFDKHARFNDSDKLQLGIGSDLNLFHDGTNSYIQSYATFYIQQYTGTLYIEQHDDDGDVVFKSDDGNGGVTEYFWLDGGEATHDGSATTALYTIFPDKSRIALGAGKDLQLYHDTSDSYIDQVTAGDLIIRTSGSGDDVFIRAMDDVFIQPKNGEAGVYVYSDGAVELYYNNSKKLETTSTGATITGNVSSTTANFADNVYMLGGQLYLGASDATTNDSFRLYAASGQFVIASRESGTWTTRFDISDSGAATFAGTVRMGTSTETANTNFDDLVIENVAGHSGMTIFSKSDSDGAIYFGDVEANNLGQIKYSHGSNAMTFATNDGAASLTLDSGLNATFGGDVATGGEFQLNSGAQIDWANGDARIVEGDTNNYSLSFQTFDGSACSTALRLDGDNAATFTGDVILSSGSPELYFHTTGNHYNWMIAAQENVDGVLEIGHTSSTGTAHEATPSNYTAAIKIAAATSAVTFAGNVSVNAAGQKAVLHVKNEGNNWEDGVLLEHDSGDTGWNIHPENSSDNALWFGYNSDTSVALTSQAATAALKLNSDLSATFAGNVNAGTGLRMYTDGSGNGVIYNLGQDKDLYLVGDDGGSGINALVFDMSEGGAATFAGTVALAGSNAAEKKLTINNSTANGIQFNYDNSNNYRNQILNYWNSSTDSRMDFNIARTSGQTPETIMSVGYGGKVGIGTVTPAALLGISGEGDAIRVESTNTGSGGAQIDLLHFTTSPADEDIHGVINMGGYYTGTTSVYGSQIKSIWTDVSERHSRLEFLTCDTTVSTALTLAHDNSATFAGNVDVGGAGAAACRLTSRGSTDDSSAYALEAANSSGATLFIVRNDGYIGAGSTGVYNTFADVQMSGKGLSIKNDKDGSNNNWSYIQNSGTGSTSNIIFTTGAQASALTLAHDGTATFTDDVIAFSDRRLKENIKTLDGSKVYDMRGVSFTKKDSGKEGSGVIAQEIQKVAPELINETDGTLGVAYGNLTGYLIEAIKDLKTEIEELKKCNKCNNCDCK